MNGRRILKSLQQLWLLVFGAATVWMAFIYLDEIKVQIEPPPQLRMEYVLVAVVFQLVFWISLASNWRRVVAIWSHIDISFTNAFVQWMLVNLGKYVPGKIWGMIARGAHMGRRGINPAATVTATLHEQVLQLHSGAIFALVLAVMVYNDPYLWILTIVALASAALGDRLSTYASRVLRTLLRKLGNNLSAAADEPRVGSTHYVAMLIRYGALWAISGLILVSLYLAFFGDSVNGQVLATILLANTVGIVAGFVAIFAPAGIGVREITVVAILITVMDVSDAVLLSVFSRVWMVATDLTGGAAALLLGHNKQPAV